MEDVNDVVEEALTARLCGLIESLLEARFKGSADLWRFQLELLELQQDLQLEISKTKRPPRVNGPAHERLETLRRLRRESRRLGDAVAWLLLDERVIVSLADNQATSVITKEEAEKRRIGVLKDVLVHLSQEGHGFPLLHDITDVLRIGDVTFVGSNAQPNTIELKSRLVSEEDRDGEHFATYEIDAISVDDEALNEELLHNDFKIERRTEHPGRLTQPLRQIDRMIRAQVRATAPDGAHLEIDGQKLISTAIEPPENNYADEVTQVIARARADGSAIGLADDFAVIVAMYDPTGIKTSGVKKYLEPLGEALRESIRRIVFVDDHRNSIVMDELPPQMTIMPELHRPYFLLPIPTEDILDMVRNRLNLVVLWNRALVARKLEGAGFEVSLSNRPNGVRPAIMVSVGPNNTVRPGDAIQIGGLDQLLRRMSMEFLTPDYIVSTISTMMNASKRLS